MDKKNWTAAEDFCLNEGGHLASIATEAVNSFIGSKMDRTWVGGNDRDEEGSWKWTDCTPWEFTLWNSGEPNNYGGQQDCGYIISRAWGHGRVWDDDMCYREKEFVCSKKICTGPLFNGTHQSYQAVMNPESPHNSRLPHRAEH